MKDNDYYNNKKSQRQSTYPNPVVLNVGKGIREKTGRKSTSFFPY